MQTGGQLQVQSDMSAEGGGIEPRSDQLPPVFRTGSPPLAAPSMKAFEYRARDSNPPSRRCHHRPIPRLVALRTDYRAPPAGLEPATSRLEGERSFRLRLWGHDGARIERMNGSWCWYRPNSWEVSTPRFYLVSLPGTESSPRRSRTCNRPLVRGLRYRLRQGTRTYSGEGSNLHVTRDTIF